jgi:WD40 repeat protein
MTTASVDKTVNIYRRKGKQQKWEFIERLKTHNGYVSRCRFCHPFRGRILATASFDTKIHIFQEDAHFTWHRRAVLNCNNSAVTDIQFCPYYLQNFFLVCFRVSSIFYRLFQAACTSAGHIIVFEAPDPLNVSVWNPLYEVKLGELHLSTLSWDRNRFGYYPTLVVGSSDPNATPENRLALFEVDHNKQ